MTNSQTEIFSNLKFGVLAVAFIAIASVIGLMDRGVQSNALKTPDRGVKSELPATGLATRLGK